MADKKYFFAFPTISSNEYSGLTKREYFAGQVLSGLSADPYFDGTPQSAAIAAVQWADALISELEKGD